MKSLLEILGLLMVSAFLSISAFGQQDGKNHPRRLAHAYCSLPSPNINPLFFGAINVQYSSPRVKGRKIYGGLVPFEKVWRLGDNEATTLVTNATLKVMDRDVPAGSYTLFAIPGQSRWTLIISKKTGEGGIPYPGAAEDLLRADMTLSTLPSPVEDFTVSFDRSDTSCTMNVDWETTRASVSFTAKKSQ